MGNAGQIPADARALPGTDVFRIVVDDGLGPATLYPFPELKVEGPGAAEPAIW